MSTTVDITVTQNVDQVEINTTENLTVVNIIDGNQGGGGVESVTGTLVDNTDPDNPIVNTPNISQVLAVAGDRPLALFGGLFTV